MAAVGRPTDYKNGYVMVAKKLAELGATDREVAEALGVTERTIIRWKTLHAEFCQALKIGKQQSDDRVEQSLYRRALGYSHDSVKIAINASGEVTKVPFIERFPPDTTAAIFWLKNRRPAEWRDRQQVEHSGTLTLAELVDQSLGRSEPSR